MSAPVEASGLDGASVVVVTGAVVVVVGVAGAVVVVTGAVVVVVLVDGVVGVVTLAVPALVKWKTVPRQASWFVVLATMEIGSATTPVPCAATVSAGVPEYVVVLRSRLETGQFVGAVVLLMLIDSTVNGCVYGLCTV